MSELSIQELSDQTGVSRRTIHFYIQQGLLPPALGAGLAARYTDEHLLRLKLIPYFRYQGKRLDEIRKIFQENSSDWLKSIPLEQTPPPSVDPVRNKNKNGTPVLFNQYRFHDGISLSVPLEISQKDPEWLQQLLDMISGVINTKDKK